MNHFIQVILPLKLQFEPFYRVSKKVSVGDRVLVRMSGKEYTGVVSVAEAAPDINEKKILPALIPADPLPPITEEELKFWRFLSEYYLCTIGEVYRAAYPDLKTNGEAARLKLKRQQEKKAIREQKRKEDILARLSERLLKKDLELDKSHGPAVRERLMQEKKRIREEIERREAEFREPQEEPKVEMKPVSPTKNHDALSVLTKAASGKPVLLQGGKERETVIAECVRNVLSSGRNCLVLVPEIKTSESLLKLLKKVAGNRMETFNSSESMGRRREVAEELRSGEVSRVYVGTRSSLFLPWDNLGLIIVENEESPSHKAESTPRLNVRDAAIMLGHIHGCQVILGSVCPSLESYKNVLSGKYESMFLDIEQRLDGVINTTEELPKRGMAGVFSIKLLTEMQKVAADGGKILILHPWMEEDIIEDVARFAGSLLGSVTVKNIYTDKFSDLNEYGLVAILNADKIGRRQDFRSDERRVQLISHLRSGYDGKMLLQAAGGVDVYMMAIDERLQFLLKEREQFQMPPYRRLVNVTVKDASPNRLRYLGKILYEDLYRFKPTAPMPRYIGSKPEEGILTMRVQIDPTKQRAIKDGLYKAINDFEQKKKYTGHIVIDVDPA